MLSRRVLAGILVVPAMLAQQSSFPKPGYFRETFARTQTRVDLKPPAKIRDFVEGGRIELSLQHYLELVMTNNTDIQVQLVSLEIPRYGIMAALGAWDPTAQAAFTTTRSTGLPSSALDAVSAAIITKELSQHHRDDRRRGGHAEGPVRVQDQHG